MSYEDRQHVRLQAIETAISQKDWILVEKWLVAYFTAAAHNSSKMAQFKQEIYNQLSRKSLTVEERLIKLRDQATSFDIALTDPLVVLALARLP